MSKLERLLNLTAALLETRRPLTADELRKRVPGYPENQASFRRAFERDKDDLREMGIPLVVEEVPGIDPPIEGYRIPKDQYYLRDPGLDPDELAALHLAVSAVRLDGVHGIEALWKLGGVPTANGPTAPATAEVAALPVAPALVTLFGAVIDRRRVRITYNDEEREVDPYRLDYQRGRWYVNGYDHLRDDERLYRVDRVQAATAVGPPGAFQRPSTEVPGALLQPWQLGEGEPVLAQVLVDADQAAWAAHHVGAEHVVEQREDGSVVLELAVTNPPAFRSFVLGFLDHAEVLEPPELRAELVEWLEAIAS